MEKKHYSVAVIVALAAAAATIYLNSAVAVSALRSAPAAVPGLSPERYLAHVTYLARDEMNGRGNGSPELEQAADYIAAQFRAAGLRPAGENNTYFQTFEITTGANFGTE